MMRRLLLLAATSAVHWSAWADAVDPRDWAKAAESRDGIWHGKFDSYVETTTERSREPIVAMAFRYKHKHSGVVRFENKFVRLSDCARGLGHVVTTDLDGQYISHVEFVSGGGNVASGIGEFLCRMHLFTRAFEEDPRGRRRRSD